MDFVSSNTRRGAQSDGRDVATAQSGEVRDALIAHAREHGWAVVGHRWLRMTRGAVMIEVWFAETTSRVVRARHSTDGIQTREVDIVRNAEYRMSLAALAMQWLGLRDPAATNTRPAAPSSRTAAHSSDIEAISATMRKRAGGPAPGPGSRGHVTRPSTCAQGDLSPA